ncbi:ATP-binding protein [Sphingomonas sp. 28-63-12]|uniref:ATP-binding protein n=1 Tax=Sphingomonas sp. 28-63-12 TaxID=1970434 RepID=UPI000BC733E0|nr:MAG: AAA family ATPase [Sphingomonas sp. 28-63-12]
MSEIDRWLAANGRYLESELRLLRKRIATVAQQRAAQSRRLATTAIGPKGGSLRDWLRFGTGHTTAEPVAAPVDLLAGPEAAADASDPSDAKYVPALVTLSQRLGLSDFERQLLLMCAAIEFDTGFGALCAEAQRGSGHKGPSFELALVALENPAWDVMSPERPLRYWRLIEIHQPGAQPLITSALRADERIVNYIKGLNYLDDRLAPLVERLDDASAEVLPPSQAATADSIADHLAGATQPPLFQLIGESAASKLAIARQVAARFGITVHRLRGQSIPEPQADNETFVRLWQREALLLPLALYVDAEDVEPTSAQGRAMIRLLNRCGGVVMVASRTKLGGLGRRTISVDVAKPLPAEQLGLWSDLLGDSSRAKAALLAGQFNLDRAAIAAIVDDAAAASHGTADKRDALVWAGALEHVRPALDELAQPITPRVGWDDIELPDRERAQLREIAAQVRNRTAVYDDWGFRDRLSRGLGISVLFAGDSGTGKTMAAEALASELGLLLYRIDLAGVVSKFIGETEKNLRKLFDAAEDGGAILFFDEADALFGKRSEVKDSHDRYANIEINYLLQRIEGYRGLAILTTNMKSALDQAFVRRLRFIVNFPFPGAPERTAIWRKVFPPAVDVAALDIDRLARLNVTGGSIHNIALNAAFAAVAAGSTLTMPIVLEAARREYLKLDKPINEADFRWLESVEGAA